MSVVSRSYIRHNKGRSRAQDRAKQFAKKAGKLFPSWENRQCNRPPPSPLIVQTTVSTADRPAITDDLKRQAKEAGVTVEQLLGLEKIPGITEEEVKYQYVRGNPLVKPDDVKLLPTRMYNLHTWYMQKTANTNEESLMVKVKKRHYFHKKDV